MEIKAGLSFKEEGEVSLTRQIEGSSDEVASLIEQVARKIRIDGSDDLVVRIQILSKVDPVQ